MGENNERGIGLDLHDEEAKALGSDLEDSEDSCETAHSVDFLAASHVVKALLLRDYVG